MRLFIAVPVPEPVKQNIMALQARLRKNMGGEKISWTLPGSIHLTLKFLGETDPALVDKIVTVMAASVKDAPDFSMSVDKAGAFPSPARPKILWVGSMEKNKNIGGIAEKLERGLKLIGFEEETREFRPHLTIGRVRSGSIAGSRVEALLSGEIRLGALEVREIQLIESILSAEGAKYRIVEKIEF